MTSTSKASRYIISGLIIGGFWYLNHGQPPWEEALRTIVVFVVIMKSRLKRKSINVHGDGRSGPDRLAARLSWMDGLILAGVKQWLVT